MGCGGMASATQNHTTRVMHTTNDMPTEPAELEALLVAARQVAGRAYAPYSRFRVGAAVRDADGAHYAGCNVENASYGLTVCAERNAIFAAVAGGARRPFGALALVCLDAAPGPGGCMPCGACRQVMAEHLTPEAPVAVAGVGTFSMAELLPHGFQLPH